MSRCVAYRRFFFGENTPLWLKTVRISKVGISGKYNLCLSPGAWPTGGFFLEKTRLWVKNYVFVIKCEENQHYLGIFYAYLA